MTMTTLRQRLNDLEPARRRGVEQRAAKLITEERSLRDLRQALELTQESLAERLGVNQENVSRLEQRTDIAAER